MPSAVPWGLVPLLMVSIDFSFCSLNDDLVRRDIPFRNMASAVNDIFTIITTPTGDSFQFVESLPRSEKSQWGSDHRFDVMDEINDWFKGEDRFSSMPSHTIIYSYTPFSCCEVLLGCCNSLDVMLIQ